MGGPFAEICQPPTAAVLRYAPLRTARRTGIRRHTCRRPASFTCKPWKNATSIRNARPNGLWAVAILVALPAACPGRFPGAAFADNCEDAPASCALRWELPQKGNAVSWGGVLATASGLVFFGEDSGMLEAVDASNGEVLWRFQTNQTWKASPMSYQFDGQQYISVAAGANILSFGLPPR